MSADYRELLDATIDYLTTLKNSGVMFVSVDPKKLRSLGRNRTENPGTAALPRRTPPSPAPSAADGDPAIHAGVVERATETVQPAAPPKESGPAPAPAIPGDKASAMADLQARASVCRKCPHLAAARTNVVFGVGDVNSPLMFVGEAPGFEEDAQGEPFVGKAGQLLTRIIQTMGFSRDTVYIANILKCRPDTPGQRAGNRKPTPDEMKTCLPYLLAQIDLVRPQVIVALGATAVEGLLGRSEGITRIRGHWQEFRGVPVMPTYHPAYLLRNEGLSEKRKVWEDMLEVLQRLGRPVSEKQRGYFLKP
jgi:uracil-DNA glycosylase family 4